MRKAPTAMLVGAIIALVAWWPIEGAVMAVFWGKVFDAKGSDDVAIDTLLAEQDEALYQSIRHGSDIAKPSDTGNCSYRFDIASGQRDDFRSGAYLLNTAIHHERNGMNTNAVYAIARGELRALPNVALGALQGCVEGSLFAGMCRQYVAERLVTVMAAHKQAIVSKADANDAKAIKMACAALNGTRWPLPRASRNSAFYPNPDVHRPIAANVR
jgi:hypothetical protein